jgi:hypothetical protein
VACQRLQQQLLKCRCLQLYGWAGLMVLLWWGWHFWTQLQGEGGGVEESGSKGGGGVGCSRWGVGVEQGGAGVQGTREGKGSGEVTLAARAAGQLAQQWEGAVAGAGGWCYTGGVDDPGFSH